MLWRKKCFDAIFLLSDVIDFPSNFTVRIKKILNTEFFNVGNMKTQYLLNYLEYDRLCVVGVCFTLKL